MTRTIVLGFSIVVAGTACGSAPVDVPPAPMSTQDQSAATIDRTIVHFNKDGTQTVQRLQISKAQDQAEMDARRALQAAPKGAGEAPTGIVEDIYESTCVASAIWMFAESTNCTTSAQAEICFYGSGTATMSDYFWCNAPPGKECLVHHEPSWTDSVLSYWPGGGTGAEYGYFYGQDGDLDGEETFAANQSCTVAGTYARYDLSLTLSD